MVFVQQKQGTEVRAIDLCNIFHLISPNILFLCLFLPIAHISNVVITPNSTDLSEFNSSVSLSCSASGSFPSFVWLNDSSEVTLSDRVQLNDRGSILTIIKVTRYDQGPFICHVFNNFSNYTSNPVKLSINCECFMSRLPFNLCLDSWLLQPSCQEQFRLNYFHCAPCCLIVAVFGWY